MPKYLFKATFTPEGLKGLRAGSAAKRVEDGRAFAASMGGAQECYYLAFGDYDAYSIWDLPDDEAAAAMAIGGNEAGAARITVTKLLTAEQVDEAFTRAVAYRPPGQ